MVRGSAGNLGFPYSLPIRLDPAGQGHSGITRLLCSFLGFSMCEAAVPASWAQGPGVGEAHQSAGSRDRGCCVQLVLALSSPGHLLCSPCGVRLSSPAVALGLLGESRSQWGTHTSKGENRGRERNNFEKHSPRGQRKGDRREGLCEAKPEKPASQPKQRGPWPLSVAPFHSHTPPASILLFSFGKATPDGALGFVVCA